jgi:hypothetical protein
MSEVIEKGRIIPAMSMDTRAVMDRLRSMVVGEVLSYKEISSAVGFNIQKRRAPLDTARRRLTYDEGIHFGTVLGVGVKRLGHAEAASATEQPVRRIARAARREFRKAQRIDLLEVPASERAAFVGRLSTIGMVGEVCSVKSQRRLVAAAEKTPDANILGLQKAFEALKETA